MKFNKEPQEIFDEEGIAYKATSSSLMINCHVCHTVKKKRAVRRTNGGNKCYVCGSSMSFIQLLKDLLGLTEEQILTRHGFKENKAKIIETNYDSLLANISSIFAEKEEEEQVEELPEADFDAFFKPVETSKEGVEYLMKRGVNSPKIWIDYDIHYHSIMGGPVFPVKMQGRIVGWQCRKINPTEGGPRMLSMPGEWKSKTLLNYDNACKAKEIGLFEGPFDSLAAEAAGLVSVATLGKIVSKRQIELLKECGANKIFIGFDPDAYIEVRELCKALCRSKDVYRIMVPEHRDDFGDCTPEEIKEAIEKAEPCYAEKTGRIEIFIDI